ncbi:MAG: hypothetical protein J6T15_04795 [Bacilli bacterium]|nr:hypothetical protein [Bacilli bacterium]
MEKEKIMQEITQFCSTCNSSDCCPEDDCVLFRIEKIVCEEDKEEESK